MKDDEIMKGGSIGLKLLVDGKRAFPEIINLIRNARKSIYINMFIWRNDEIGRCIAAEILKAADRNVKVTISKDRYGAVLEYCEECKSSFFHRDPTGWELISSFALEWFYHLGLTKPSNRPEDADELYYSFINHRNIRLYDKTNKYDHSKYYIFDEEVVVLGGINIEDKELTVDYRGQSYHDYMVKVTEEALVSEFTQMTLPKAHYKVNLKKPERHFEMRETYLKIINEAEVYVVMLMAYISTLPDYMKALLDAAKRGVDVKIVIPVTANFQDDLNKKCIRKLIKKSGGAIKAYLYPNMLHAKLLMSEKVISVGSCNITKKAFKTLDELNLLTENDGSCFAGEVRDSVKTTLSESKEFTDSVKYDPCRAFLESLIM